MKIAVFFSDSTWASWSFTHGLVTTLRCMGHEAISCGVPATARITRIELDELKARLPRLDQLQECDAVLVCGPEHVTDWVNLIFGHAGWIQVKAPKLGWYHESFVRPDYRLNLENYKPWIDFHFMPNPQDAEKYGQEWLPAGVDTVVFRPENEVVSDQRSVASKRHDVAFVGLLYPKRAEFLRGLRPHIPRLRVRVGNVEVRGLDGTLWGEQTEMLARTYREMQILLNLPSLSNVLVMKVLEAMACGTCVFTPHFNDEIEQRLGFMNREHLVFYREDQPSELAGLLRHYLKRDEKRERVARTGCEEVQRNHRLEQRLAVILEKVGERANGSLGPEVTATAKA
jgi:glycosyltransferase involved in cell wall biosynthesis